MNCTEEQWRRQALVLLCLEAHSRLGGAGSAAGQHRQTWLASELCTVPELKRCRDSSAARTQNRMRLPLWLLPITLSGCFEGTLSLNVDENSQRARLSESRVYATGAVNGDDCFYRLDSLSWSRRAMSRSAKGKIENQRTQIQECKPFQPRSMSTKALPVICH
jgi:hypothetical protein